MPTSEEILEAHRTWEKESACWIIDQNRWAGKWLVNYRPPLDLGVKGGEVPVSDDSHALMVCADKSEALWYKRDKLIEAMLTAVEKFKQEKANVKG